MLDLLVQGKRLVLKADYLPIDAHTGEALFLQVLEELRELAFLS